MVIAFTPSELLGGVMALAAAIVGLWAAFKAVLEIIRTLKKPNDEQDKRIAKLEDGMKDVLSKLDIDNKRLNEQQKANRAVMTALQALLQHGINGNNVKEMKDANQVVNDYLVSRQ